MSKVEFSDYLFSCPTCGEKTEEKDIEQGHVLWGVCEACYEAYRVYSSGVCERVEIGEFVKIWNSEFDRGVAAWCEEKIREFENKG